MSSARDSCAASHSFRAAVTVESSPTRLAVLGLKVVARESEREACSAARERARWRRAGGRWGFVSESSVGGSLRGKSGQGQSDCRGEMLDGELGQDRDGVYLWY